MKKQLKSLRNAERRHKDIREAVAWNETEETVCLPKVSLLYLECFTRGRRRGELQKKLNIYAFQTKVVFCIWPLILRRGTTSLTESRPRRAGYFILHYNSDQLMESACSVTLRNILRLCCGSAVKSAVLD